MRSFLSVSCLLLAASASFAQKLPNVQLAGLRAPAKVKADGKLSEWGDLQAYNKATQIFYSMANDKDNLYLVLQAKEADIIKKMISGGISLSINSLGKKDAKNSIVITYPHYDIVNKPFNAIMTDREEITKDIIQSSTKTDSLMNVLNKQIGTRLKMIRVEGIKTIEDNIISVYNNEGIKAVSLFDNQINYTCELVLPLKILNLTTRKFSYNIKLNGPIPTNANVIKSGGGMYYIVEIGGVFSNAIPAQVPGVESFYFPTDFWGEYELVK
jgi:hypothetical protein